MKSLFFLKHSFFLILSASIVFPLSSYAKELPPNTLASVNGQDLSLNLYQFLLGSRQREDQENTEFALSEEEQLEARAQIAEDLVLTEVLAQEALRLNVDKVEINKIEIDLARKTLLAQMMVKHMMDNISVSDERIRAIYDAEKSTSLYRFNLWRMPSRVEATKLLAKLKDGKTVQHVYEKVETPWLDQNELEPSILGLVDSTKVGDFVSQVIEQDGIWKVAQLIDKSKFEKPPFEDAKNIIRADLIQEEVDEAIRKLSMNADIQINNSLIQY